MKSVLSQLSCVSLLVLFLQHPAMAETPESLSIGSSLPVFDLPGVDGKNYQNSSFDESKLLMVIFTCNHCPTAQAYEERINKLYEDYHAKGVAIVAISPNDPAAVRLDELGYSDLGDTLEDMKIRAKNAGFKFPYLYDGETQNTSKEFGVLATPHVFIFDEKRKLQYAGRIDDHEIKKPKSHDARNALDDLLAGTKVRVPETRPFGCSTKWASKRDSARAALKKWNNEKATLKEVSPKELKELVGAKSDNYRLINVWATWCIPCVEELDELVEIHRMYRKRNFELITVSADDVSSKDSVLKTLNEKHCSANNVILAADSRDDLYEAIDVKWKGAVPYTLLVAPDGTVVHRIHDEIDPLNLKKVIADAIGRTYANK